MSFKLAGRAYHGLSFFLTTVNTYPKHLHISNIWVTPYFTISPATHSYRFLLASRSLKHLRSK